MSRSPPIGSVIVAGGGLTAWSCAAALKRRIPTLDVKLINTGEAPDALADRLISTLPSIHGFHEKIGLTDEDTIVRAGSGPRLGTSFDGWATELPAYVHAYGPYGAPIDGVPFHQLWVRDHRRASLPPFDRFSQAAEFARSGRAPPHDSDIAEFGLQLTLPLYQALMRDYALHLGVLVREASLKEVVLRSGDGFIDSLVLNDGRSESADLFVDCTGPAALLHSAMHSPRLDWRQWLPCNRMVLLDGPPEKTVELMDEVASLPAGWRWTASSPRASVSGVVYRSEHADEDSVQDALGTRGEPIELRAGRTHDFWIRNCVAVGDAAVAIEPLEWTNLHLAHSQIDRIVTMMPGRDCSPIELVEFNRQCAAEADRVRDFVCLHYVCSQRSEPFWKEAAAMTPPDSLAHTLELFAQRGRLPFYEEETFTRDSWLAVLLGQGFMPHQVDPLTDLVPPAQARPALAAMRQSLASFTFHAAGSTLADLNPRGAR